MISIIRPSTINNNQRQIRRWHEYPSTSSLELETVQAIINASQLAIHKHKSFHLVLAGGTTPRRVYEQLRTLNADLSAWHIYFGDERCLPVDHAERNSLMTAQAWLDHVNIPASHIHTIPAELGAEVAANAYAKILNNVEMFDLVLLGLGEDGHTASLFPNHDWGTTINAPAALAVHDAPKAPPDRVSLSAHRLSQTRQLIFLVTGEAKRQAIMRWRNGEAIPATAITPDCGVDIFVEKNLIENKAKNEL